MAKTTFEVADEVAEIAERLIPQNHAHLLEHGVRMVYLFRDDTPKKNGKMTMGVARKVTGVHAFLAGAEIDLVDGRTGEAFFAIVMTRPAQESGMVNVPITLDIPNEAFQPPKMPLVEITLDAAALPKLEVVQEAMDSLQGAGIRVRIVEAESGL